MNKTGSGVKILAYYSYMQCCAQFVGFISLIGGTLANFAVPGLLGVVVDAMLKKEWDKIDEYCLGMLIIVVFSGICVYIRAATFNTMSERIA
jgi:ABC-type bacteriocin/lantibiotic exporter with double-glycine peptidase domain